MLKRIVMLGGLLIVVSLGLMMWSRLKLEIDERYHEVPLGVTSHQVSPKLKELMSQDTFLDAEGQAFSDLALTLAQLKPSAVGESAGAETPSDHAHHDHDHQDHSPAQRVETAARPQGDAHNQHRNHRHGARGPDSPLSEAQRAELLGGARELLARTSCLLYTSPSPRDLSTSRMPSSA